MEFAHYKCYYYYHYCYLETLNAMTTDSFLNALRHFISCRGKVHQLRSLKEIDRTPVRKYLTAQDCESSTLTFLMLLKWAVFGKTENTISSVMIAAGSWHPTRRRSTSYSHDGSREHHKLLSSNSREHDRPTRDRTSDT